MTEANRLTNIQNATSNAGISVKLLKLHVIKKSQNCLIDHVKKICVSKQTETGPCHTITLKKQFPLKK